MMKIRGAGFVVGVFAAVCAYGAPNSDLAIRAGGDVTSTVTLGTTAVFDVIVTNNGPDAASGVIVQVAMPQAVSFVVASTADGSCNAAQTVQCTSAQLAARASLRITLAFAPTQAGELNIPATVSAATPDPQSGNNVSTAHFIVVEKPPAAPNLTLAMTTDPPVATVGQTVRFTLHIGNNGTADALGTSLTMHAPPSLELKRPGGCSLSGGNVTCSGGVVAIGRSWTVAVDAVPKETGVIPIAIALSSTNGSAVQVDAVVEVAALPEPNPPFTPPPPPSKRRAARH